MTLHYSDEIENAVVALRRTRKLKLLDAMIAATAQVHELTLLTLDRDLLAVAQAMAKGS